MQQFEQHEQVMARENPHFRVGSPIHDCSSEPAAPGPNKAIARPLHQAHYT